MAEYFKSLPILTSPSIERRVASSRQPSNVNAAAEPSGRPSARQRARRAYLSATLALAAGCAHREPPAPDATPWTAAPDFDPPAAASVDAGSPAATAVDAASRPPVDPGELPQTRDVPSATTADFARRATALWTAIVNDDPDAGMPFFFPLSAYRQVKDVGDPAADWKRRLVAAYVHDIHALHAHLGPNAARARLVGLDVPNTRARWVEPGEEWNKLGYYRVFGSKLRFQVDGVDDAFDVKSLISWRGEWYVVHLVAIR